MAQTQAQPGDTVRVRYEASLPDGTKVGSTSEGEPVEVTLGGDDPMPIPGMDLALVGMSEGESKVIQVAGEQIYGAHRADLVKVVKRSRLPESVHAKVGTRVKATTPDGTEVHATITKVTDTLVTLDANHPLSDKDIRYKIVLDEVVKPA